MVALEAAARNTGEDPPRQTSDGLTRTKKDGGVTGSPTTLRRFQPPANVSQTLQLAEEQNRRSSDCMART